jgi:hypothetical protein
MAARTAKILVLFAALAGLTGVVNASAASAPTNLHPFALRADESRDRVFSRTPAFAWNPVRGALRYEFQLATGSSFRENGIVYADSSLTTPVAAPSLTLPWISGSPHALYARVRAVLASSTTHWSAPYGFDMQAASIAAPLPSQPGLLRWTPVDGAVAYQVWFVDIPKVIATPTNVADEREFYAFHQSASWLGTVRWRVRAIRNVSNHRANGLPATSFGAWSPVYSSVNPPFSTGQLRPLMTVSDVVANGSASSPAHRLTPAFVFGGNASGGFTTELYRVHVYTDKQCVNRVYSSTIIGSPAYAPRESGPLELPTSAASILAARGSYLGDGAEGTSYAADNFQVIANESLADVKPTSGLPRGTVEGEPAGSSAPAPAPAPAPTPGTPTTPAQPTDTALVELVQWSSDAGPPIGLWDTDWDRGGGYYWTVVPVEAFVPGAASTTLTGAGGALGGSILPVATSNGFAVGDAIMVGSSGISETATITAITSSTITITPALKLSHAAGENVVRMSGSVIYRDTELAQDACAAGRVLRFGKESEPALTAGGEPFISGLSPTGKLASATESPAFYGTPLVAWTAALGSDVYAVQWSKTSNPFKPETDPATTALGMMTLNTTALLPLEPGTWYYRVRGYSFSLPLEAQAMSWSTPQKIVVTRPTFTIVHDAGEKPGTIRTLTSRSAGLSIRLPSSFHQGSRSTASVGGFRPLGRPGSSLRVTAREGSNAALFIQTIPDRGAAWATKSRTSARHLGASSCSQVSLAAGAAVRCTGTKGAQMSVVYMLQHRGVTYTLTFAGKPSRRAADAARFAAAARSLRFTR